MTESEVSRSNTSSSALVLSFRWATRRVQQRFHRLNLMEEKFLRRLVFVVEHLDRKNFLHQRNRSMDQI